MIAPPMMKPSERATRVMIGSIALRKPVPPHDRPVLEALRPRRQDVVLAERLEHRRAHDQRVLAEEDEAERQRRQDHVLEAVDEDLDHSRRRDTRASAS